MRICLAISYLPHCEALAGVVHRAYNSKNMQENASGVSPICLRYSKTGVSSCGSNEARRGISGFQKLVRGRGIMPIVTTSITRERLTALRSDYRVQSGVNSLLL